MPRIQPLNPAQATGKAKQLLDAVQAKLGLTPNMMKTMAQSPAVLEAYLNFSGALAQGSLDAQFREEIALAVAQTNSCDYCLSAHTTIGALVKLTTEEIAGARQAQEKQAKRDAGLKFAKAIVIEKGEVTDDAVRRVRAAGYTDGEIAEIVANVAINIFTNYFNHVAETEVDFPLVCAA